MTLREKLKKEHPEAISDRFVGGCEGCPDHYGYAKRPTYCNGAENTGCTECWNREMEDKMEKTNLQKAFAAVGVELEIGQRFELYGETYYMTDEQVVRPRSGYPAFQVFEMFNNPKDIKLLPTYSPETIEHARHDIYRFRWVTRSSKGLSLRRKMGLGEDTGPWNVFELIEIPPDQYPEVQPGQCVALADIVGGGQDG